MAADNGDQDGTGATGAGQQAPTERPFRFSLALPLGQLFVCAALIVIVCGPRSLLPVTRTNSAELRVTVTNRPSNSPVKHADESSDHQMRIRERVLSSVWLLNIPGAILQMQAVRYATHHQGWLARAVNGFTCSLLSGSVLALPFWWIIGRGVDALLAMKRRIIAPRIGVWDAAVSLTLLCGALLLVLAGLLVSVTDGYKSGSLSTMVFLLLWCLLGAIPMRARYKQLRITRAAVLG